MTGTNRQKVPKTDATAPKSTRACSMASRSSSTDIAALIVRPERNVKAPDVCVHVTTCTSSMPCSSCGSRPTGQSTDLRRQSGPRTSRCEFSATHWETAPPKKGRTMQQRNPQTRNDSPRSDANRCCTQCRRSTLGSYLHPTACRSGSHSFHHRRLLRKKQNPLV